MTWWRLLGFCLAGYFLLAPLDLFFWRGSVEGVRPRPQAPPSQQVAETPLLANVRQLTFQGRRSGEGYFSPDGGTLIFQSEREPGNPFFQIYLLDLESGETHRVSPGYGKTTCGWIHPSGDRVLFASTHADPQARAKQERELGDRAQGRSRRYAWDFDEHYDLYQSDLGGDHLLQLTREHGYDAEGSWSPDGRLIVFSSNRHAYREELTSPDRTLFESDKSYLVDLYLMEADGSNVRRLTESRGYDGGPFFSPDGSRICWRRFSPDGATAEIYTMPVETGAARQVTRLGAMSWAPFFHPSGEYLIFTTNLHGFENFELYLVDSAGAGDPVRVTTRDGFDGLPSFSPDGRTVVWTSNRTAGGQSQLFRADWDHEEARRRLGLVGVSGAGRPDPGLDLSSFDATRAEVRSEDLRLHVERLSSAEMEGRLTGSEGARRATDYVASAFRWLGLEPAGEAGSYFEDFEFTAAVDLGSDNRLRLLSRTAGQSQYQVNRQWRPLAFSAVGTFGPSAVVFAGYGLVAPADGEVEERDAYAHLDVRDKWVMVFRYLPENVPAPLRQQLARHASLRYKAMQARQRGARGMLVVSGPNSGVREELIPLAYDASQAGDSLAVLSITDEVAEALLRPSGRELKELQDRLDEGQRVMGFELGDFELEATIDLEQQTRTGRNVLARLSSDLEAAQTVILGAHLDHLGRGLGSSSLAGEEEQGAIHYGADDNASGVAGMLEIAQHLLQEKQAGRLSPQRHLLLAAWSGEELGLLGSSHFVRRRARSDGLLLGASRVVAYLNLDMIGRLEQSLVLQGVGSSSIWPGEIERHNVAVGLPIVTQNDSYLPTDATAFYLQRVPVLSAFTGVHADYHTPRDTADKINYAASRKVVQLMDRITRALLLQEETPDYIEMEKPQGPRGRVSLRAYLGTIPDYSQSGIRGVKLSGVTRGGPAAAAGVRAGDIIVELSDQGIENIYDYTYAIDALKVGVPVRMAVVRDGERLELEVTPGSRD